jgi:hypothetical protein
MAVRLVVMDHHRRGQAGHVAGSPDCGNVPASGAVDFAPLVGGSLDWRFMWEASRLNSTTSRAET